jgi:integrase
MATAKKLKSGSWRCLVYDYTDANGNRKYKSFTCDDPSPKGKRKAELMAAEYAANKTAYKKECDITFEKAMDQYIEKKEPLLSPYTITGYYCIRRCLLKDFPSFCQMKVSKIKQEHLQDVVNSLNSKVSQKTIRNRHGFISAVLEDAGADLSIKTKLPEKTRPKLYVPTDADIKKLISVTKDTELEVPIMLAAFGMMRRGEICALALSDISGTIIHVHCNKVRDHHGDFHIKSPKTYSGDRYVEVPQFVIDKINEKGYITNLLPDTISKKFGIILEENKLPHFRFHDLRHYSASIRHALGIPDAYIMQAGGWKNDTVLKQVYRHTMSDKIKEMNDKANSHFTEMAPS